MGARLFVGNLSHRTTEQQLERFFSSSGTVASVRIPLDRQTGRSRGFGFVEFADEELAELALAVFNGRELGGRPLRLDRAQDPPNGGARHPAVSSDREPGEEWSRAERNAEAERDGGDDYIRPHRRRKHKGGKHGSDRRRGGTRRVIH